VAKPLLKGRSQNDQKSFASFFVTAQVWRSPPRKASGKGSGSFLKKRTKKLLQIQAEPLRKGRSQFSKRFLLLFFKKEGLPAACLTCDRLPGQLPFFKKRSAFFKGYSKQPSDWLR
jgi:hypothetical protein